MILGTVELGLDYGINNSEGKPSKMQAFELLDTAWNGGIRELDTAAAYGDSELKKNIYRVLSYRAKNWEYQKLIYYIYILLNNAKMINSYLFCYL